MLFRYYGFLIAFVAMFAAPTLSMAGTTVFYNPVYKGKRLDWCVNWAQGCGKSAADRYCRYRGFKKSVGHVKANNIGLSKPTRLIGTGAICDQAMCDGFRKIKCFKPTVKKVKFIRPKWQGKRLDWCVNWAQGCGKAAANKFCKAKGFTKSYGFGKANNIGASHPTRLIGTGAICDQAMCDGFSVIGCVKK